jgi:hypothetical protein
MAAWLLWHEFHSGKKKKVIGLKKTDFRNGAWWYMIQWKRKQVMDNIRDSSSITYRTTNTWRVRYSCTSLPENPIKVGVAIPSTKPTIYSLVSCPVHLPICELILTPGNAKTTQKSSLIRRYRMEIQRSWLSLSFFSEFRPKGSSDESWM